MSYSDELNSYIMRLRERLRLNAWLRGAAVFAGTALLVTTALVLTLNHLAFPARGVAVGRGTILCALALAAAAGIAWPLRRLTQSESVRRAEAANPALGQRLTTFHERETKGSDPFLELLAADTLRHAEDVSPAALAPDGRLFAFAGVGLASLAVLVWMIAAGPGYLGYGAALLWRGGKNVAPLYAIAVEPGDVTVRRNSDQLITVRITGMEPEKVQLFAHFQSAAGWEPVTMRRMAGSASGATYQFAFAGLPESVEYYVSAGPLESAHYKVRVADLPSIRAIHVTYRFPTWTGMASITEDHSGDLRAIEGTNAQVEIETDRPLKDGQFVLDDGRTVPLSAEANGSYWGVISMNKDGAYHLASSDEGQPVRVSEDYFIATDKAMPPEISMTRPGGDYRASPIEEVTLGVKGADAFGLKDMHLHYSVNGGPDKDVSLLKSQGAKSAEGAYTLPLEDFKLTPGDLVSVYATAKDGHSEARTDIAFIQVDPFERQFSQSQESGGGGGGGGGGSGDQTEISKREKELIGATWKQQNDKAASGAAAQGQFLSEAQQKLRDQVNALSARMQSRDISQANKEFTDFDKDMRDAAAAMAPAADKLKGMQWKDAMPLEQKALQALLRAEATFRQIQVAFGQRGGGGGGGGSAGRDLASLFDLELDTAKNQYETAQNSSAAEQREKDVEDTLAKLDALAKRQEELAARKQDPQKAFEERWQQEMLRREAEQLQHQMEQMAQNGAQAESGSATSQQSGQGAQSQQGRGQGQQASSGAAQDKQVELALSRLQQATGMMRRGDGNAQQAADALRQAENSLAGKQQQLASGKVDSMAREAERLKQQESKQAAEINKFAGQQETTTPEATDLNALMARRRELGQLAQDRQQLSDDVSKLEKNLRDAARQMAPTQPGTAQGLRDALTEMDNADLDNRVQRSADWLRRGVDPHSNGTEEAIAKGLSKLSQQLQQAQKAMGQEKQRGPGAGQDQAEALHQMERLRSQVEAMGRSDNPHGQDGQGQGRQRQGSKGEGNQDGREGQRGGRQYGQGQLNRNGQGGGQDGQQQAAGGAQGPSGDVGGARNGEARNGGGTSDGVVWNNVNTGNNRYGQGERRGASGNSGVTGRDTERDIDQGLRALNQLRQATEGDPQATKDLADLTRQMQHLDPSRFPGNPEMVEQMRKEMLSSIDRLELQLERNGALPQARTGNPDVIPPGYQDSVAEYYRTLSKKQ